MGTTGVGRVHEVSWVNEFLSLLLQLVVLQTVILHRPVLPAVLGSRTERPSVDLIKW